MDVGLFFRKSDKVLTLHRTPCKVNPPGKRTKRFEEDWHTPFPLQSFPGGEKTPGCCVCVFFFSGRLSALQTCPQAWWQSQGNRSSRGSVDYVRGPFGKISWSMVCLLLEIHVLHYHLGGCFKHLYVHLETWGR